ncbi:MAG: hypothetical protein V4612_04055 [Pseudomonadota bacterium]
MNTKSITALLIVVLGQSNILLQSYVASLEKAKYLSENIEEKHTHGASKKLLKFSSAKQSMATIKEKKLVDLKINFLSSNQENQSLIVNHNLKANYAEQRKFNYSSIKSIWFGCCENRYL